MDNIDVVVFGSVALDVLCYPVEETPRYESISFEQSSVGPGGCASNVAIGLRACSVPTALVARIGDDESGALLTRAWQRASLDLDYLVTIPGASTGVSVGLVDREGQPRFIHSPGASGGLVAKDLRLEDLLQRGARRLHVGGYFVLPGLFDPEFPALLAEAQRKGLETSLDVVSSPGLNNPEVLWPCLEFLDTFMCNQNEAGRITGLSDPEQAARFFRKRGVQTAIIKLGAEGVWADGPGLVGRIASQPVDVVDTTGAGDGFAVGYIVARLRGQDLLSACQAGNRAGAQQVGVIGAVAGWDAFNQ
jgi:sugar/nucleoside kinase (ribokinase family)